MSMWRTRVVVSRCSSSGPNTNRLRVRGIGISKKKSGTIIKSDGAGQSVSSWQFKSQYGNERSDDRTTSNQHLSFFLNA